ncbi:MAG: type II toxin-antitoxin system Phd/YefM family antitoxin [Lachnospiraceae bacterium]|nr:type II toxin-antitoxin system Phd/YefM family antitoxin [Lachnospiraceae bacterium]
MPQIIPIKSLKETSTISDKCHESDEPIFITKNGYGDMVIMSMEVYEATLNKLKLYKEIELSESQISSGKTKDARESLNSMREKYGI